MSLSTGFPGHLLCFCSKTRFDVFGNCDFFSDALHRGLQIQSCSPTVAEVLDNKPRPAFCLQIFGANQGRISLGNLVADFYRPKCSVSLINILLLTWQPFPAYTYKFNFLLFIPCFICLELCMPYSRQADSHCMCNTPCEKLFSFLPTDQNFALAILITYSY